MKKIYSIMISIALLLSCLSLAACGEKQDSGGSTWRGIQAGMDDLSAITDRTEYYDITVESEPIFQWMQEREESPLSSSQAKLIAMQFYQGEPVQLWGELTIDFLEKDGLVTGMVRRWDVFLYRQDQTREILLQGIDSPSSCHGYLDQEGNLYWWKNSTTVEYSNGRTEKTNTSLKKYSASGKLLFEKEYDYDYDIKELRQTADGRVYLIVGNKEDGGEGYRRLAELDPATGLATESDAVQLVTKVLDSQHLGVWGDKLATFKLLPQTGNEVTAINADDGTEACIFSFTGTSYVTPEDFRLQDFRIMEDESVEILWTFYDGGTRSLWERLRMEKVTKTPIVLRGINTDVWLSPRISSFNRSSKTYHVVVEDCGRGNEAEDFARLTSVQIATGKGPDILCNGLMNDYISGMIEKGALEDLRPYMERSGIREEDYFPFAFGTWRDGDSIYGVIPATPVLAGYLLDSAVLGGTEEPDIETLVDALLARYAGQTGQEDIAFLERYDSQKLLTLLLRGTDTLWGMVDWEKGICDFSGDLFAKILETAKQYGDNGDRGEVSYIAKERSLQFVFGFDSISNREKNGKTICGVMFDDGCHAAVTSYSVLAVNANSPNKEGAWEFISFLLGDEVQSASNNIPAARKAFGAWVEQQRERVADGREIHLYNSKTLADGSRVTVGKTVYTEADITDEIVAEYVATLEDARPYPLRTAPILDIISEEAEDYFNGTKSAAEVARLVTNRVQLYLDESYGAMNYF